MNGIKTYSELYLAARRKLRDGGIEAYDIEARILSAFSAHKSVEKFLQDSRLYVTDKDYESTLDGYLNRRLEGEPVAYITGEWEFFGLPIHVSPDTLIPRPDSELLAQKAIDILHTTQRNTRCIDLCTGSGCVGLAISTHVPNARVVLADVSLQALNIARMNIKRLGLSRMVTCVEANAEETPPLLVGRFDVLVCNPPYIRTEEIETLDPSVKNYEPKLALDGGKDGLRYYRAVVKNWSNAIMAGGYILFECGYDQSADVCTILNEYGYDSVTAHKDSQGIERVVIGRKIK